MAAVFSTDQNFENNFEKDHPRNNLVKLFQILTSGFGEEYFFRISSCPYNAKSPRRPFFRLIKISRTSFEKGHPRNNPVKLFQNRTRGFRREDFLRISSCSYLSLSPTPPPPTPMAAMSSTDQNFANSF